MYEPCPSTLECFERRNASEIRNGIMFNFDCHKSMLRQVTPHYIMTLHWCWLVLLPHYLKQPDIQHTLTGRCTPRPSPCSLTCASTVSHQVVACVTTVGGCLCKCCSSSVTNLAISWVSQRATVHNCLKGGYTMYTQVACTKDH